MFPNGNAITRNPKLKGRTFIEQTKKGKKHIVNEEEVEDKIVIIVEDSFVRGKTIEKLVKDLKKAKAREIHLRFCCPPILGICAKAIDIRTVKELFIPKLLEYNVPPYDEDGCLPQWALDQIAEKLGVDSVRFLPVPGVAEAIRKDTSDLCMSCVHGQPKDYHTQAERDLVQIDLDGARSKPRKKKKNK
jgi:amidophosphoribosyltransferase